MLRDKYKNDTNNGNGIIDTEKNKKILAALWVVIGIITLGDKWQ